MGTWLSVVIAKPLAAVLVLFLIRCFTEPLRRYMPECRLKRVLFFSWKI